MPKSFFTLFYAVSSILLSNRELTATLICYHLLFALCWERIINSTDISGKLFFFMKHGNIINLVWRARPRTAGFMRRFACVMGWYYGDFSEFSLIGNFCQCDLLNNTFSCALMCILPCAWVAIGARV